MKFSVYTPDAVYDDNGVLERSIARDAIDLHIEKWRGQESLDGDRLANADGLLVWQMVTLDGATLGRLDRCRVIVRCGVGFNNIDIAAAAMRNIPVCNTPDYGTGEVADHTIGLLLALERGLIPFDHALRADPIGNFDHRVFMSGRRLAGRTFATIGLGTIGTATALRAKAFGMNVVVYDPFLPWGQEIALGVERVGSLDDLLAKADVVSLHAPLNEETANIINAYSIAKLKPGAIILNTARGGLVDLDALFDGLKSGHIRAAGIDVLPIEPPSPVPKLLSAYAGREAWLEGRLLLTPHAAWSSVESRDDARTKSMETMRRFLVQGEVRNCVNRALLPSDWREQRIAFLEGRRA